jgi:hypothetical protein
MVFSESEGYFGDSQDRERELVASCWLLEDTLYIITIVEETIASLENPGSFAYSVIKMTILSSPASKLLLSVIVMSALVAVRFAACKVCDRSWARVSELAVYALEFVVCALLILSCLFSRFCSNRGYSSLGRQN